MGKWVMCVTCVMARSCWRRENLRLQNELLASQEKVFKLQDILLSLRRIVNSTVVAEQLWTKE